MMHSGNAIFRIELLKLINKQNALYILANHYICQINSVE
jgi:hypothetical protein